MSLNLQGYVHDATGNPVANATVACYPHIDGTPTGTATQTTTTDANGKWGLTGLTEQQYDVQITNGSQTYWWKGMTDMTLGDLYLDALVVATTALIDSTLTVTAMTTLNGGLTVVGTVTLPAGSITGTEIASGTITGGNIAAGTITGGNIAATTVADGNISSMATSKLTGTVADAQIAGMSASKLIGSVTPSQISPQGSGSTLNADLLDSHDSTYFATASSVSGLPKVEHGRIGPQSSTVDWTGNWTFSPAFSTTPSVTATFEWTSGTNQVFIKISNVSTTGFNYEVSAGTSFAGYLDWIAVGT